MPLLLTRLINVTGVFLYPAYCSYKALARRPPPAEGGVAAQDAALERWLQYWSLVGAWTALEAAVGFALTWLPFYTLCKTVVFLYLALSSRGTPYMYATFLAPLFAEHEPAIDEFIAGVRGQAGAHARGSLGWIYERIRQFFGLSEAQAAQLSQAAGYGYPAPQGGAQAGAGGFPAPPAGPATAPQPPTLSDPVGGAMQGAAGMLQGLASKYLPSALAAVSAAAGAATGHSASGANSGSGGGVRGFDVGPPPNPPSSSSSSQGPSAPAGSRTFAYASEEIYTSSVSGGGGDTRTRGAWPQPPAFGTDASRSSSDASLSGGSGSVHLASSFTEIRREEADGADMAAPPPPSRAPAGWMPWSTSPKGKAE